MRIGFDIEEGTPVLVKVGGYSSTYSITDKFISQNDDGLTLVSDEENRTFIPCDKLIYLKEEKKEK